jgi:hypothetical protein
MESRTTGKAERARLDGFIRVTTGRAPYCAGGIGSAGGRWPAGGRGGGAPATDVEK